MRIQRRRKSWAVVGWVEGGGGCRLSAGLEPPMEWAVDPSVARQHTMQRRE